MLLGRIAVLLATKVVVMIEIETAVGVAELDAFDDIVTVEL